ncbi:monoacylglycerol lipase ABHD6 [Cinnamomum micranthum f. kanehirae]|uniref:Monoacylglycerol lipase ABHD6 n=1 Tax=Cinnamomum micranthum f. kanehirae TaxID=337451 RepID=A0A443NV41_9MAGN|nr:monoacylglycerol lipase ABHD6 [Cinnamomum micranthum f. kanehirae]
MVNFVAVQKLLLHRLMKSAGLTPQTVEIDPMTVMNMWVPLSKTKGEDKIEEKEKPAVVLIHGFAADGVVTWEFQVGSLAKKYAVYVPDLIFFGASTTDSSDRSPAFQAEMVVRALGKFGVRRCAVVGFSYGGTVAIKMAELWPEMVTSLVVSGSVLALTESISETILKRVGFSSWSEMLLPNSVKGLKAMFSSACYKKLWFPDRLFRDYLQVMFTHRKEREELLESMVIRDKDLAIPHFSQPILLLWGENDRIFNLELAKNMKEQVGDKVTLQGIEKAGHLVHLERPCVYNRCLKKFLATVTHANGAS